MLLPAPLSLIAVAAASSLLPWKLDSQEEKSPTPLPPLLLLLLPAVPAALALHRAASPLLAPATLRETSAPDSPRACSVSPFVPSPCWDPCSCCSRCSFCCWCSCCLRSSSPAAAAATASRGHARRSACQRSTRAGEGEGGRAEREAWEAGGREELEGVPATPPAGGGAAAAS